VAPLKQHQGQRGARCRRRQLQRHLVRQDGTVADAAHQERAGGGYEAAGGLERQHGGFCHVSRVVRRLLIRHTHRKDR
jgi:hypothetical protein